MDIIKKTARKHKTSESKVRCEINSAITAAEANPSSREMWDKLFPDGRKPTPEEFIVTIARFIRENRSF